MKAKHTHRIARVTLGQNYVVYKCMDGCSSYKPPEAWLGEIILCWACRAFMKFNRRNLRQNKPRCENPKCALPKSPRARALHTIRMKQGETTITAVRATDDLMKRLGLPTVATGEEEEVADVVFKRLGEKEGEEEEQEGVHFVEVRRQTASDELLKNLGLKSDGK